MGQPSESALSGEAGRLHLIHFIWAGPQKASRLARHHSDQCTICLRCALTAHFSTNRGSNALCLQLHFQPVRKLWGALQLSGSVLAADCQHLTDMALVPSV